MIIEDAKTTRGADVVSTIRASYYKTGKRNIRENIVSGKGYEGVIEETRCLAVRYRKYLHRQRGEEENPPHVELGEEGIVNSLTTVQKDNLVMEKNIVIDIYNNKKIDGEVCGTITAHGNASSTTCGTFGIVEKEKINKVGQPQCGTVVSDEGLSPTLSAGTHGYANGFFDKAVETAEKGNAEIGDTIDAFNGKVNKSGISPTITTRPEGKKTAILPVVEQYRIRKLTPRECWRLMAFSDEDFDKAEKVVSNTQLYRQSGNSIVVTVLMAIFLQMNIQGLKSWNDRNEDEIRELIK